MPEPTQYLLSLTELMELIIKKAGIHEGLWVPSVGMQVGMGAYGPDANQQYPGVAVAIVNFGIQKLDEANKPLPGFTPVDAAKVNPRAGALPKLSGKKKATA